MGRHRERGEACQHTAVGKARARCQEIVGGIGLRALAERLRGSGIFGIVLQHWQSVGETTEGKLIVIAGIFHIAARLIGETQRALRRGGRLGGGSQLHRLPRQVFLVAGGKEFG